MGRTKCCLLPEPSKTSHAPVFLNRTQVAPYPNQLFRELPPVFPPGGGKHDEGKTGRSPCGLGFTTMEKSSLCRGSKGIVGENAPISLRSL